MLKIFSFFIYKIIYFFNQIFFLIVKRNFTGWLLHFLQLKSYKKFKIDNEKEVEFFTPNYLVEWRVRTFLTKEPETIDWINNFKINNEFIFWDVGANIGLYSIYAALKFNKKIKIIAFEPSSSNIRILTRNISINNFSEIINVNQIALTDKKNVFLNMNEPEFIEGSSLNTFGENFNYEGKEFRSKQKYKIFGTTLDNMIDEKILMVPDYIKIDVDGIEHLILRGGDKLFFSKKIKSVLIEINENFENQKNSILSFMQNHNFKFIKKENNPKYLVDSFKKTFNYIFEK